jgi:hypothetical protein
MRRTLRNALAAVTTTGAVIGLSLVATASAGAYQPSQSTLYSATAPGSCNKNPCVLYPKSTQLPGGRLVAAFEDSESTVVGQTLPVYKSDDYGTTWQKLTDLKAPAALSGDPAYAKYTSNWTNPYLYVLPQDLGALKAGTLLLADVVSGDDIAPNPSGNGNRQDIAIALYASTDQGASWSVTGIIATGPNQAQDPVWEPYLMMYGGKLVAYYSDENDYLGYDATTGVPTLDPANATATDSGGQILAHKTWDGVGAWSAPVVDVSGATQSMGGGKTEIGGGRPGMTNIVPTTDGKWMLTYEYWGGGDNIRYKIADDPTRFFADGDPAGKPISSLPVTTSGKLAQGGSPVLIRLPDGRLAYNAAGSADVWVNDSGSSTGSWKEYRTPVAAGYSRDLQYVSGTGRIEILQATWGNGSTGPIHYGEVDLGRSDGAYYSIVNRKTGQVLSTEANKAQDANFTGDTPDLISWADNPANDTQRWHVVHKGSAVTLLNKAGGRSVAIWTGAATAGQRLAQWVDDNGSDKLWNLVATADGYYRFQSVKNPSLFMSGATAGGGVTLATSAATGDYSQDWKLVQQAPVAADLTAARQVTSLVGDAAVKPGAAVAVNAATVEPNDIATHAGVTGHAYAVASGGGVTDLGTIAFDASERGTLAVPSSLTPGGYSLAVAFDDTPVIWDTLTVATAKSASAVSAPAVSTAWGTAATLSVTVTAADATPTGTVTLTEGSTPRGTAALNGGSASFTLPPGLAGGDHALSASYSGDAAVEASTADTHVSVTLPADWSASTAYSAGATVSRDGQVYRALWYSKAETPGATTTGSWQQLALTEDGATSWTASRVFTAGDRVDYQGRTFAATWYTRDETPGSATGPWQEIATTADGTAVWTPSRIFSAGDRAALDGVTYVARWYSRGQVPTTPNGAWAVLK